MNRGLLCDFNGEAMRKTFVWHCLCVVNNYHESSMCGSTEVERMFVGQMFLGQLMARIWELFECYWRGPH